MIRTRFLFALLLFGFCFLTSAQAQLAPGIAHLDEGRLEEARTFFADYAKAHPKDAEAFYYIGRVYFEEKEFDKAAKQFKKALDLDAVYADAHYFLGAAYGRIAQESNVIKQGTLARKIKAAFERAIALDPDHLDARSSLMQYYMMAPGFMGGSAEKALQQAQEIRKRDATRGNAALAKYYLNQKDYAEAEKLYRTLIAEKPDDITPYFALAQVFEKQERYEDGFGLLEQALKATNSPLAAYRIGRLGAVTGLHLDRALEAIEQYLQYDPTSNEPSLAWANYRLGMIYEHQNKTAAAKDVYATALRLDADHEEVKKALKRLR